MTQFRLFFIAFLVLAANLSSLAQARADEIECKVLKLSYYMCPCDPDVILQCPGKKAGTQSLQLSMTAPEVLGFRVGIENENSEIVSENFQRFEKPGSGYDFYIQNKIYDDYKTRVIGLVLDPDKPFVFKTQPNAGDFKTIYPPYSFTSTLNKVRAVEALEFNELNCRFVRKYFMAKHLGNLLSKLSENFRDNQGTAWKKEGPALGPVGPEGRSESELRFISHYFSLSDRAWIIERTIREEDLALDSLNLSPELAECERGSQQDARIELKAQFDKLLETQAD